MYSGTTQLQHLSLVIRAINVTSCNRRRPTLTYRIRFASMVSCWMISFTEHTRFSQCVTQYGSAVLYTPTLVAQKGFGSEKEAFLCLCVPAFVYVCLWVWFFTGRLAPRGLQRKMRHQIQAVQQMTRPAASTARSATFLLSQRTKKKPRMTSTPHRLYMRLLPSSPKLKWRCVRGVTMVCEFLERHQSFRQSGPFRGKER